MAPGNVVHMVGLMPPSRRRVCGSLGFSVARSLSNLTWTHHAHEIRYCSLLELAFRAGSFPEMCLYYFSHLLCYTLLYMYLCRARSDDVPERTLVRGTMYSARTGAGLGGDGR